MRKDPMAFACFGNRRRFQEGDRKMPRVPAASLTLTVRSPLISLFAKTPGNSISARTDKSFQSAIVDARYAPQYWYEKSIVWLMPSLAPCGALSVSNISAVEMGNGFSPIASNNYASLPVSFFDMPIYKRYAGYREPNVYEDYRVWVTAAIIPLAPRVLISLRIGIQSHAIDEQDRWDGPGPIIPVEDLRGAPLEADSPQGPKYAFPRYSYYAPDIVAPPGVYDPFASFSSLAGESGPV